MKTIQRLTGVLAALTWLARVPAAEPATDQPVGEFSDVTRVTFAGNRTFTEEAIRDGLLMNPDFLLAAHPAAPMREFLPAIERQVTLGYQSLGFPQPQVTCRLEAGVGRIAVTVVEGPRYRRGEVRVSGTKKILLAPFIRRLVEPFPPPDRTTDAFKFDADKLFNPARQGFRLTTGEEAASALSSTRRLDKTGKQIKPEDPIWEKGEPAPFAEVSRRSLVGSITNALAEFGFFYPKLTVNVLTNATGGTADLRIDIQDEGPPGVLGKIELAGNKQNSREQILKYLGLAPGVPFSQDLLTQCELRLWNSARFLHYSFVPEPPKPGATNIDLHIDVVEYVPDPSLPPLTGEFSPEEKVLLKLHDWLTAFPSRNEDLVISSPEIDLEQFGRYEVDFVISPGRGLLYVVRNKGSSGATNCQWAMSMTAREVAIFSPRHQQKLVMGGPDLKLNGFISVLPNEPGSEVPFNLGVGAGFAQDFTKTRGARASAKPAETGVFTLDLVLAPAGFIYQARHKDFHSSLTNGVLHIASGQTNEHISIKIEVATGRPIEWAVASELNDHTKLNVFVRAQAGAYERLHKELEQATQAHKNVYDSKAPLSSTASFVIGEFFQLMRQLPATADSKAARLAPATAVFKKLLEARAFSPLDGLVARLLSGGQNSAAENFSIPVDTNAAGSSPMQQVAAMLSAAVFKYSNDLFPKGSWPWTLARESVFVVSGKDKYTGAELNRLYESKETGPIGFWWTAHLLKLANSPLAKPFARRGLMRLFAEDFQKDCHVLFGGNSLVQQSAAQLAAAVRDLPDADLDTLAGVLPEEARPFVRDAVRALRAGQGRPLEEVLAEPLAELWEHSLKQKVRSALRELAK